MKKILEFGRKTMFYIRVLSGYEERRLRALKIQIDNHRKQSEERKAAIRKIPEQIILKEVRRLVEEMQNLNKRLEETEAAIDDYFKPLNKEAQRFIDFQLEGEEKTMKQMLKITQEQALDEQAAAMRNEKVHDVDTKTSNQESECSTPQQQASAR